MSVSSDFTTPHQRAYKALDELLKAIANLPMNYILTHPPLHNAFNEGTTALDRAVKEGRYVVQTRE